LAEKKDRELTKDDHWINFLRCINRFYLNM
jgi:hypothetical protein